MPSMEEELPLWTACTEKQVISHWETGLAETVMLTEEARLTNRENRKWDLTNEIPEQKSRGSPTDNRALVYQSTRIQEIYDYLSNGNSRLILILSHTIPRQANEKQSGNFFSGGDSVVVCLFDRHAVPYLASSTLQYHLHATSSSMQDPGILLQNCQSDTSQ